MGGAPATPLQEPATVLVVILGSHVSRVSMSGCVTKYGWVCHKVRVGVSQSMSGCVTKWACPTSTVSLFRVS